MSTEYYLISKEKLDLYFSELGKLLKKKNSERFHAEIVVVGGASILLNYSFRLTSNDIDCSDRSGVLMNDIVTKVAEKYNLPSNWINTDFVQTNSYSNKLDQYSEFYKTYGYGALDVRTIKDEYLIAMKIVSGRKYKNDYSDIFGIVNECRQKGKSITIELVEKAIVDLYGSLSIANKDALDFTKTIIESPESLHYETIKASETKAGIIIKDMRSEKNLKSKDVDYVLKKLGF